MSEKSNSKSNGITDNSDEMLIYLPVYEHLISYTTDEDLESFYLSANQYNIYNKMVKAIEKASKKSNEVDNFLETLNDGVNDKQNFEEDDFDKKEKEFYEQKEEEEKRQREEEEEEYRNEIEQNEQNAITDDNKLEQNLDESFRISKLRFNKLAKSFNKKLMNLSRSTGCMQTFIATYRSASKNSDKKSKNKIALNKSAFKKTRLFKPSTCAKPERYYIHEINATNRYENLKKQFREKDKILNKQLDKYFEKLKEEDEKKTKYECNYNNIQNKTVEMDNSEMNNYTNNNNNYTEDDINNYAFDSVQTLDTKNYEKKYTINAEKKPKEEEKNSATKSQKSKSLNKLQKPKTLKNTFSLKELKKYIGEQKQKYLNTPRDLKDYKSIKELKNINNKYPKPKNLKEFRRNLLGKITDPINPYGINFTNFIMKRNYNEKVNFYKFELGVPRIKVQKLKEEKYTLPLIYRAGAPRNANQTWQGFKWKTRNGKFKSGKNTFQSPMKDKFFITNEDERKFLTLKKKYSDKNSSNSNTKNSDYSNYHSEGQANCSKGSQVIFKNYTNDKYFCDDYMNDYGYDDTNDNKMKTKGSKFTRTQLDFIQEEGEEV